MSDSSPDLATKLSQNGAMARKTSTRLPPAEQLPVEVREAPSRKPKRLEVITTRGVTRDGKPFKRMTAAPGFEIDSIIFTSIDNAKKLCRPIVITRKRKGRPHNNQRAENGGTEE